MAGVGRDRTDRSVAKRIRRHWRRCDRFRQVLETHAPDYDVEAAAEPPAVETTMANALDQSRFRHLFRE